MFLLDFRLSEDAVSPESVRLRMVRFHSAKFSDCLYIQSWYSACDSEDIISVSLLATGHLMTMVTACLVSSDVYHLVLHHPAVCPLVPSLSPLLHPEDLCLPVPGQAEYTSHQPLVPVIQKLALNYLKLLKH